MIQLGHDFPMAHGHDMARVTSAEGKSEEDVQDISSSVHLVPPTPWCYAKVSLEIPWIPLGSGTQTWPRKNE
jgi:hypothetical protein